MAKEVKTRKVRAAAKTSKSPIMDLLLENSIALQKTLAGLAVELKTLNGKVSSLCDLFEEAGKNFGNGTTETTEVSEIPEFRDKMDILVKQNKIIAKGLLLLEKLFRESKGKKGRLHRIEEAEENEESEKSEEAGAEYKPKPLPEFTF